VGALDLNSKKRGGVVLRWSACGRIGYIGLNSTILG